MKLTRYKGNPILKPKEGNEWESQAIFNCAAVGENGHIHLLYRAVGEYEDYISRFGYAVSEDGINFQRFDKPVFEPQEDFESFGCEDPRVTRIEDTFYITYTALFAATGNRGRVALASTKDFKSFHRHGVILPGMDDKNAVLFPEKINGKYVMFHRLGGDIRIAYSDDLTHWDGHEIVMQPRAGSWDCTRIGAGAPPLKTENGWLMFYHGYNEQKVYRLGVALFDLAEPVKLIARQDDPILEPEEDYELNGDVPNAVFVCGIVEKDDSYYVYYGGADKVIAVATVRKAEALDFV